MGINLKEFFVGTEPEKEDLFNSNNWGLAHIGGASGVASLQYFYLANADSGSVNLMIFAGGGVTVGVNAGVFGKSVGDIDFTYFRTKKPCNFRNFEGEGARFTEIDASLGIGFSGAVFTIFDGGSLTREPLGYVEWSGVKVGMPSLSGHAGVHGVITIRYGPVPTIGKLRIPLVTLKHDTPIKDPKVKAKWHVSAREPRAIVMPESILFEFDSARLKPQSAAALKQVAALIASRPGGTVKIEGHTDKKGPTSYNMVLSKQRADAVMRALKAMHVKMDGISAQGFGESRPTSKSDAENRRVEVVFSRQHPLLM